jgi:hypothetical protein
VPLSVPAWKERERGSTAQWRLAREGMHVVRRGGLCVCVGGVVLSSLPLSPTHSPLASRMSWRGAGKNLWWGCLTQSGLMPPFPFQQQPHHVHGPSPPPESPRRDGRRWGMAAWAWMVAGRTLAQGDLVLQRPQPSPPPILQTLRLQHTHTACVCVPGLLWVSVWIEGGDGVCVVAWWNVNMARVPLPARERAGDVLSVGWWQLFGCGKHTRTHFKCVLTDGTPCPLFRRARSPLVRDTRRGRRRRRRGGVRDRSR